MALIRICESEPLANWRLRLKLTNGEYIVRDVSTFLHGPVLGCVRQDETVFRAVRVEVGTVVWPNGADLCPDVLIWGGMPPENAAQMPTGEAWESVIAGN